MAMKKMLIMSVLACLVMACNGDGGGNDNLPPTVANSAHNGGGFHASNQTCESYCGEGDTLAFPRGINPALICEHSICFVDDACLYGCPDELVFPPCVD
jgi:hypothetical protein